MAAVGLVCPQALPPAVSTSCWEPRTEQWLRVQPSKREKIRASVRLEKGDRYRGSRTQEQMFSCILEEQQLLMNKKGPSQHT